MENTGLSLSVSGLSDSWPKTPHLMTTVRPKLSKSHTHGPLRPTIPNTDRSVHSTDAYYPFSAGKHSCVGINFAWHEMRVVLANLLSRMDVQEVAGQTVDFRQ
jgi:hypothetical protein